MTSGASTYVQCTSPIRRYPDLTNHYYIKAALRKEYSSSPPSSPTSSSVFSPYVSRSSASSVLVKSKRKSDLDDAIYTIESKIPLLEDNVSDEDKIQTLNAVRMVSRHVRVTENSFDIFVDSKSALNGFPFSSPNFRIFVLYLISSLFFTFT